METVGRDKYLLTVKRHVALDAVKFGPILTRKQDLGYSESYAVGVGASFLWGQSSRGVKLTTNSN